MDKFDYVTATIEEEKDRLSKIIAYLKEIGSEDVDDYQERYNDILLYLNAKDRYVTILNRINEIKEKLEVLNSKKDEYELDNLLLEDTLLNKFHEDTNGIYRNLLYENIKNEDENIRDILYLLFEKQNNYSEIVIKRNRLRERLDKVKYPNTYDTLLSQDLLIEKQDNILDDIFILENNIKIESGKLEAIEKSVMTDSILKLLYEFWIINSYDINRVDKSKLFTVNRSFISIKEKNSNNIEITKDNTLKENKNELSLPNIDENTVIDINNGEYVK